MDMLTIHDKNFQKIISEECILKATGRIAEKMNKAHEDSSPPVLLCVLNGAFMFASDLTKQLSFHHYITFIKVTSYVNDASTGRVNTIMGLDMELKGRDVIIVEDIIDTGLTIQKLHHTVMKNNPRSIRIVTAFLKKEAFNHQTRIDDVGLEVPNRFLIGYGLDYNGIGRNLRHVYQLDE